MSVTTSQTKVLAPGEGLRLQSGPGRDLIFKVTGDDTGGAFDYFIVEVARTAVLHYTLTTTSRKRSRFSRGGTRSGLETRSSTSRKGVLRTFRQESHTPSST